MEFWAETGARAAGTESQAAQQLHNSKKQTDSSTTQWQESARIHIQLILNN